MHEDVDATKWSKEEGSGEYSTQWEVRSRSHIISNQIIIVVFLNIKSSDELKKIIQSNQGQ